MLVGTGGLTLFPGTPLLEEAKRGEFAPLSEKEMLEELKLFVENLTCDCSFITHHTITGVNLTGEHFLQRSTMNGYIRIKELSAQKISSEQPRETASAPQVSETQAKTESATKNSTNTKKASGYPTFDFTIKPLP